MSNSIPLSEDENNELNNISSQSEENNFLVEQPSVVEPSNEEICKIIINFYILNRYKSFK